MFRGPIYDDGRLYFEELMYYGPDNPLGEKPLLAGGKKDLLSSAFRKFSAKGGWLQGFEGGSKLGHTIEKHVAKSIEFLENRLKTEKIPAASSFHSEASAEFAILRTLGDNKAEIGKWLKGKGKGGLAVSSELPLQAGYRLDAGSDALHLSNRVEIRLVKSESSPYGFIIKTAILK